MTTGEYLSSNAGISYPFKQNQDIPDYITRLFADARISEDSGYAYLSFAKYDLGTGILSFVVNDTEYSSTESGMSTYVVVKDDKSAFVIDRAYLSTLDSFEFSGKAIFEESCVDVPSRYLRSIEIYNGENDPRNAVISGDIVLAGGYNTEVSDNAGDIVISVNPGAGLGTVPCVDTCDEDVTVSGESLASDDGNIVITGDSCYDIRSEGDKIYISGKCVACCQCQDYIDVVMLLKNVAGRVENTKKDITGDKTDQYFEAIQKKTVEMGYPDLDIQIDIAPDSAIAGFAKDGDREVFNLDGFQSVRVTVVVTNMCGVPCFIAAPCAVTAEKVETYDNDLNWLKIDNLKYIDDKRVKKLTDICSHGVVMYADMPAGMGGSGIVLPSYWHDSNEKGWLEYSSVRGPAARTRSDVGSAERKTMHPPGLESSKDYFSIVKNTASSAVENLEKLAITDLNAGKNPSNQISYGRDVSIAQCPAFKNGHGSLVGHLANPGESFTISNVYSIPGDFFAERKSRTLAAYFTCGAFAPMLAYSYAYNFAVSKSSERTEGGNKVYYNTWVPGRMKPSENTVFRTFATCVAYDVNSGDRTLFLGNTRRNG